MLTERPWTEGIHCQRIFTHGSKQEYFEVKDPDADAESQLTSGSWINGLRPRWIWSRHRTRSRSGNDERYRKGSPTRWINGWNGRNGRNIWQD